MDETHYKIMNAAMELVTEKGYSAMTTKEIANRAGVNESTLFRKFDGKKDIVTTAMEYRPWHPHMDADMFHPYQWDLTIDLVRFAKVYLDNVTPAFVALSIGLRSPELYEHTAPKIMKVPRVFKDSVKAYLDAMVEKKKLKKGNTESLSIMFLSVCFGFVFFKASFKDDLTAISTDEYIQDSVEAFVKGIGLE